MARLTTRLLTSDDGPIVEQLFGRQGACGGCWCMYWRLGTHGRAWQQAKGEPNRQALMQLIRRGRVHAVLAFRGDEPVGWCCFGPPVDFPKLGKTRAFQHQRPANTWSIVCFYIPAKQRGRGVGTALLKAATRAAFALGAERVEGYPVAPRDSQQPMPAAFAWTGVPALFEAVGFLRSKGTGDRPVYIKDRRRRPAARPSP